MSRVGMGGYGWERGWEVGGVCRVHGWGGYGKWILYNITSKTCNI